MNLNVVRDFLTRLQWDWLEARSQETELLDVKAAWVSRTDAKGRAWARGNPSQ